MLELHNLSTYKRINSYREYTISRSNAKKQGINYDAVLRQERLNRMKGYRKVRVEVQRVDGQEDEGEKVMREYFKPTQEV